MKVLGIYILVFYIQIHEISSIQAQCWRAVSSGFDHSMAIHTDGSLWAWGAGISGQLGEGLYSNRFKPVSIAAAESWKSVECGNSFTIAIRENGTLWAWGDNSSGVLGIGNRISKNIPTQVGRETDWEQISAGNDHCLALKRDGSLWAWGRNDHGQLGDQTTEDALLPKQIGISKNWNRIAAGKYFSMALQTDGTLWTWGRNSSGQLGDGTTKDKTLPVKIGTFSDWIQISCSPYDEHSAAIRSNHSLWLWGNNAQGQLGDGTTKSRNVPEKLSTGMALAIWIDVKLGYHNSFAVHTNGLENFLFGWGDNASGMFGDGSKIDRLTPELCAPNKDVQQIAPGYSHVVAVLNDSSMWSWGSNASGRLGLGVQDAERLYPGKISCPNVIQVKEFDPFRSVIWYPNPVTDRIYCTNSSKISFREVEISLFDFTGVLLYCAKVDTQVGIPVPVSLSPGLYCVKLRTRAGEEVAFTFLKG